MSVANAPSVRFGVQQYQETWAASTSEVLTQIAGSPFRTEPGAAAAPDSTTAYACFSVRGALTGEQVLAVTIADGLRLSQLLMGETPDANAAFDNTQRDALTELFRQVAGAAAVSLGASLGSETQVVFIGTDLPAWARSTPASFHFQLSNDQIAPIALHLQLSPELSTALHSLPSSGAPAATPEPVKAPPETNLDLLKDIELNVTLRFGERQLLLRDILELVPGAVVELDQHIQEPVELLVGKKVIARGDVVVVEGNYGLRVTEILSPVERIESLRN